MELIVDTRSVDFYFTELVLVPAGTQLGDFEANILLNGPLKPFEGTQVFTGFFLDDFELFEVVFGQLLFAYHGCAVGLPELLREQQILGIIVISPGFILEVIDVALVAVCVAGA